MEYLQTRTSDKIEFHFHEPEQKFIADVSPSLFEWVLENIMKNAVDAVAGSGRIDIRFQENTKFLYIDINDNGKGIPKSNRKDIFKPGFTTKARGWGLGLSLSKRIIEEYHSGKIYVLNSEIDKGTTIRVGVRKRKAC
ncbi:MAG: ATP-binding protein [Bacteroidota bacterium]